MKISQHCPACHKSRWGETLQAGGSHGSKSSDTKDIFTYIECLHCGSWSLQGVTFDKAFYRKYYSDTYYIQDSGVKMLLEKCFSYYRNKSRQQMILSLFPKQKKSLRILDIGSGDGTFISSLSNTRFSKSATDVQPLPKEHAHKVTFYHGDFLSMQLPKNTFDVITAWHVIEHISDPQLFIDRASSLLTKGGMLMMSTPNSESFGFQKGKEMWFHLDAPRHIVIYSKKGLLLAARKKLKLKKIIYEHFEFPLDLFWTQKRHGKNIVTALLSVFSKRNSNETFTAVFQK